MRPCGECGHANHDVVFVGRHDFADAGQTIPAQPCPHCKRELASASEKPGAPMNGLFAVCEFCSGVLVIEETPNILRLRPATPDEIVGRIGVDGLLADVIKATRIIQDVHAGRMHPMAALGPALRMFGGER